MARYAIRDGSGRFSTVGEDWDTGDWRGPGNLSMGRRRPHATRLRLLGGEIVFTESGGLEGMRAGLRETRRRAFDMRPAWAAFKPVWFAQNEEIFEEEGIPPWAALREGYAAWKSYHYPGQPILQRTGRLRESLTSHTGDTVWEAHPRSLQMGSAVPYSTVLQEESDNMRGREHVVLLDETFAALMSMTQRYVVAPIEAAFRAR